MYSSQGDRLKFIRTSLSKTQQKMSDFLEIPLRTYQAYEKNKNQISTKVAITLMQKVKVSIDWILTGKTCFTHCDIVLGNYINLSENREINKEEIFNRLIYVEKFYDDKNKKYIDINQIIQETNKLTKDKKIEYIEKILKVDLTFKEILPWMAILDYATKTGIYFEWLIFGTINLKSVNIEYALTQNYFQNKAKEHINIPNTNLHNSQYQNIIDLLPYASEKFLEGLSQKLNEFKKEQEEFFKIN